MITGIDHLVLTVRSLERTCAFYTQVLGLQRIDKEGFPTALLFGKHKINVHEIGHMFEPKAAHPTSGSGDFCLLTSWPVEAVVERLRENGVPVEVGPVQPMGRKGR